MATRYISPVGSNTAPYDTLAKGATSLTELLETDGVSLVNTDITYFDGDNGTITESPSATLTVRGSLLKATESSSRPYVDITARSIQIQDPNAVLKDIDFISTGASLVPIYANGAENILVDSISIEASPGPNNTLFEINATDDVVVQNCIFKNAQGPGLIITGTYSPTGCKVINNTFYNCANTSGYSLYMADLGSPEIVNNIIYEGGNVSGGGRNLDSLTTPVVENNIVYNVTGTAFAGVAQQPSELTSDPLFVTPGTDFHLQSGSPARNSGIVTTAVLDFDGVVRPQESIFDMGALEYFNPDVTPPTWEGTTPDLSNIVVDGADANVQIDEDGNAYLVVVPDGATAPSPAEVKAGQSAGGGTPSFAGNIALTASTPDVIVITGLTPALYDVYFIAEDSIPNLQAAVEKRDLDLDIVNPVYADGYPQLDNDQKTEIDVLVKTNESGDSYAVLIADDAAVPSIAQVKAGEDGDGNAAIGTDNDTMVADTELTLTLTGMNASENYDVYVIAEDASGNSAAPVRLDVNRATVTINPRPVDVITGLNMIDRASRRIKDDSFLSLAARWAEFVDGKLQAVTTNTPGKIHKFPLSDATANDYESNDVKVGRIATMETVGARVVVNINGYVPGIEKGEKLIVSVEAGEEGKLRSPVGATSGTYEIVARCENIDNDTETLSWVLSSPEFITVS